MAQSFKDSTVSTEWLADHLNDDSVRIFDCTVKMTMHPEKGYQVTSGRAAHEKAHIPGASFVDLTRDFSDRTAKTGYMMPSETAFIEAASAVGLSNDHQIVLYSSGTMMWSTRFWWMLRSMGFHQAAILDGGLAKWTAEDRPVAAGQSSYPAASFSGTLNPALWADKDEVLQEIGSGSVCTINALSRENYLGTIEKSPYGRKGRIKGSLSVPYSTLLTEDGTLGDENQLRAAFAHIELEEKERIIFY